MSNPASQSVPPAAPTPQVQDHAEKTGASPLLAVTAQNAQGISSDSAEQNQDAAKPLMVSSPAHSNPVPPPNAQSQSGPQSLPPVPSNSKDEPQLKDSGQNDIQGLSKLQIVPVTAKSSALASIAPAPRNLSVASLQARTAQKAPRAKRRRLTGFGKRWSNAADQFVREIPPVPCFSDPRRQVPMRDMRGWIAIIAKNSQKLVWDRFMGALRQEDLSDGGDLEVCRYILASVIYEAQDPNSSKTQTRQAVNNAIKRELTLPKSEGQTGRGQTFRELFRTKATQAGFMTSLPAGSQSIEEDVIMLDKSELALAAMPDSGVSCNMAPGHPHTGMQVADTKSTSFLYGPRSRPSLYRKAEDAISEDQGVNMLLQAAGPGNWNAFLQTCGQTYAGERAYWSSPYLRTPVPLAMFIKGLVDKRYIHDLKRILVDFRWILNHACSSNDGILHLVKHGYDVLLSVKTPALNVFEREGYRLIRNALMLIRPFLQSAIREPLENHNLCSQLATQLYGRLLKGSLRFAVISTLLASIRMYAERPWLRPLNPCFESPRTDIAMAIRSGVNAVPSAIAMSKDGELVITAGDDSDDIRFVRVWDISSGKCVSSIIGDHKTSVLYLAITPNKKHVISCAGAQLMFWNIMDDKGKYIEKVTDEIPIQTLPSSLVLSPAVLPDSKRAVVAHVKKMRIWNICKGKIEKEFPENSSTIFSLDVTPDGKYLVSGDQGGWVSVWRMSDLKKVWSFPTSAESVFSVSVMKSEMPNGGADGTMKVVTGSLGSLKVWSLHSLQGEPKKEPQTSQEPVELCSSDMTDLRFSSVLCSGTKVIFSGSDDGIVRMWKLQDKDRWEETAIINDAHVRLGGLAPSGVVGGSSAFIAVSDDGKKVASSTTRPLIPVYDIGQYEESLRAQHGILNQSYFPYRPESVCHTDMYAGDPLIPPCVPGKEQEQPRRHGLSNDLGVYFHVHADDDLRIVKHESGSLENVLQVMVHDTDKRMITFDENIQSSRCGSFCTFKNALTERKGVAVRFIDQSLAFFEVELTASTGA